MPPYVISQAEGEWLARGALAALEATLAEEAVGPDRPAPQPSLDHVV
jgi:adenosylmethionine-8-amino-7-oxononanoate aminotransferase